MLLKKSHPTDHPKNQVLFTCHSETAAHIFLAGSFNGWDPAETPMMRGKDGHWSVEVELAPGRYEYKFVVDGEWCCEPGCSALSVECANCILNDVGTMNRVREVM